MKNIRLIGCLAALILISCEETNVVEEMQRFDERFIPVWIAARTGNAPDLQKVIEDLQTQWEALKTEYELEVGPTVDWLETYECLEDLMNQTVSALENQDMPSALEHLDGIRFELINLRSRYAIPYDLDRIWEFEMAFALVKSMLKDSRQALSELNDLDCVVEDMNIAWEKLSKSNPITLLPVEKRNTFKRFYQEIATELNNFNKAVEALSIEAETMPYDITRIEGPLLSMLALFGGTSPIQKTNIE